MNGHSIHQRALSLLLSITMVCSIFMLYPVGASADTHNATDTTQYYQNGVADTISLDLENGPVVLMIDSGVNAFFQGSFQKYNNSQVTIHDMDSGDTVRIYQSNPAATPNSVFVWGTAYPYNLTLDGVNIDTSQSGNPASYNTVENEQSHCACCISAALESDVNLTLEGQNKLKSGPLFAGLQVEEETNQGQVTRSSLTISGGGSLTATGGAGAAGIGGGVCPSDVLSNTYMGCGDITINGGIVTANGGEAGTVATDHSTANVYGGAGIGGGGGGPTYNGGNAGNITIGGSAEVAAYGSGGSAGIGGGAGATGGSGGTVSISAGTVSANGSTAFSPDATDPIHNTGYLLRSAGIGGGGGRNVGGDGGAINISGGTVTTKSSGLTMATRENARRISPAGYTYVGTISQISGTYDIYYGIDINGAYRFQAVSVNNGTQGTFSDQFQVSTDGAGIGSGGVFPPSIVTASAESGGDITISGGTVTAESTAITDAVLGGTGIGNCEAPYYYFAKTLGNYCNYALTGSCTFSGGSVNTILRNVGGTLKTNLVGHCAVAPAPTNEHGTPVYKTTAVLPDINTPTAVTVTTTGGSSSPAQTDAQGGLSVWLPATNDTNTVSARVSIDGTERSYEMKGAVKTDGTSELTLYRADAGLDNLTFNGQTAFLSSPPNGYQVNVGSGTAQVTIQKDKKSDLCSFTINGTEHSGTEDTVTLALLEPVTNLSIHIVAQDNTAKDYTVRVMRTARNDAALSGLSMSGGNLSPAFNPTTTKYTANVSSGISNVTITPITSDPDATFTVNGSSPAAGQTGVVVPLNGTGSQNIIVEVTAENGSKQTYQIAVTQTSSAFSGGTSAPSLPSLVTNAPTGAQAELSGAAFPANVTAVSLSETPSWPSSATDPQTAAASQVMLAKITPDTIGSPFLYNIKLLDQNGSPVTFTGSVTVRLPLPSGLRGTPHVFRYEESTGTFTDMNAKVDNGFLVFSTTHFSDYVVAGMGNSITLDTLNYQMPISGKYQIGVKLTGSKAASVKFHSTNDKIAAVVKMKNDNYEVVGKETGTVYVMFDVYDGKNKFLTHASVRVDVKTGIRSKGDSTRQIGLF